jgi:aminomethyltransferase
VPAAQAEALARALLAQPEVKPIGLGARNSLRLEAGLCLYGNDIDTTTTPVEAALNWAMQKVRRTGGARAGGFPGADKVLAQLDNPASLTRKRVGLVALERVPVREHTELQTDGPEDRRSHQRPAGPTLNSPSPWPMSPRLRSAAGARAVNAMVRGKPCPCRVRHALRAHRYYRG